MLYKAGPVSVYVRVKARFGTRVAEWLLACVALVWGLALFVPGVYDGPTFAYARHLVPGGLFGGSMAFFGALRLVGLFVNGARQDVTPWIRVAGAAAGFMAFIFISFSFALAGILGVWIAIYPTFAVFEVVNIVRAAHDAGEHRAGMA